MSNKTDPKRLARRMYDTLVTDRNAGPGRNMQHATNISWLHAGGKGDALLADVLRSYLHLLLSKNDIGSLEDLKASLDRLRRLTDQGASDRSDPQETLEARNDLSRRRAAFDAFVNRHVGILTLATIDNYDEYSYLIINPDVNRFVAEGSFKCGLDHFLHFGVQERRGVRVYERRLPAMLDKWVHKSKLQVMKIRMMLN